MLWPVFTYKSYPEVQAVRMFPVFSRRAWDYTRRQGEGIERRYAGWSFSCLPTFSWWDQRVYRVEAGEKASGEDVPELERETNELWPLWKYERTSAPKRKYAQKKFSILWWLYDYRSSVGASKAGAKPEERTRTRILWRLMHYERDGGRRTLDLFPFITWDRKEETEFRKVSFMWRFFRYERDDEGRLKLDALFIPIWRGE